MLNIARLSCVLFCSTLYPASCTVEVSRLILSVLGCTLVTRSTKPSHVPLIFGQLSDTLISDTRTVQISFHNDSSVSCFGIELSGSFVVAWVNLLSITSGFIGRIPVLLKLESTFSLVNEDCQAAQKSRKKSPFLTMRRPWLL
jgi:hypothetical protein